MFFTRTGARIEISELSSDDILYIKSSSRKLLLYIQDAYSDEEVDVLCESKTEDEFHYYTVHVPHNINEVTFLAIFQDDIHTYSFDKLNGDTELKKIKG